LLTNCHEIAQFAAGWLQVEDQQTGYYIKSTNKDAGRTLSWVESKRKIQETTVEMVGAAGIEPATLCLEGRCSIRLSYAPLRHAAPVCDKAIAQGGFLFIVP
jgi:hypothetical protein